MTKVGLFGGTFDPIHFGHIHLALQLREKHGLDKVLFSPAYISPYKTDTTPFFSAAHRLNMVKLAIEPIEGFEVFSYEVEQKRVSYTIDTVRMLVNSYDKAQQKVSLHLLLGEDALADFSHWKESAELAKLAPPLIGSRSLHPSLPQNLFAGLTPIPIMEISSTDIRERLLRKKLYCGHLLPKAVLEYILANQLG